MEVGYPASGGWLQGSLAGTWDCVTDASKMCNTQGWYHKHSSTLATFGNFVFREKSLKMRYSRGLGLSSSGIPGSQ